MNASVDAAETSGCTASGSVDSSFGIGGVAGPTFGFVPGTAAVAEDVVIDDQQRIVVAGGFASGPRACLVTRYLTSGVLDQSFGAGGTSRIGGGSSSACWFNAVALQADQKIVAAGSIDGHTFARAILARFLPDGDLDPDFGDGGIVLADSSSETVIMGVVVDDAQRIVVAQESSDWQHQPPESHFMTMRYLSDGTLDSSFGSGGVGAHSPTARTRRATWVSMPPERSSW